MPDDQPSDRPSEQQPSDALLADEQRIGMALSHAAQLSGVVDVDQHWTAGRRRRQRRRVAAGVVAVCVPVAAAVGIGMAARWGPFGDLKGLPAGEGTHQSAAPSQPPTPRSPAPTTTDDPQAPSPPSGRWTPPGQTAVRTADPEASAVVTRVGFGDEQSDEAIIRLEQGTGAPGWRVAYQRPNSDQPFGPIELPGDGLLVLELTPAPYPADLLGGSGRPPEVTLDTPPAGSPFTGAQTAGPYEGKLYVFLGVPREQDFSVTYDAQEQAVVVALRP